MNNSAFNSIDMFDLAVNKCATVAEMFSLGWEVNGKACKCLCRRKG